MDLRKVVWSNEKKLHPKWTGSKEFLVKDAFDDSDAIMKVRKIVSSYGFLEGSTFQVTKIVFNENGVNQ